MKSINSLALLLTLICFYPLKGQDNTSSKIAILPFNANGIDAVYIETAESILRLEIGKLTTMDIISVKRTLDALSGSDCKDNDCALEIGKKLNASQVVGCKLSALGEKVIVQYSLLDILSNKEIVIDQVTTSNIEELETVMKRVAKSVVEQKPITYNVEIGTILNNESEEPLRRSSRKNIGLSFGYLYPQDGYDDSERSFVGDLNLDYELEEFAVGMLLGIRRGFAMNVYGSYLFTKTDFCPFIGGAFGFHWVSHDDFFSGDKRGDGFEITANTGMRILHTYNFQIILKLDFIFTLNDYNDKAIVFTIGIL